MSEIATKSVTLRIKRYNPEAGDTKPHLETYHLDGVLPTDRVLDLLLRTKWEQDGSLVFRRSCAHGITSLGRTRRRRRTGGAGRR